MAKELTAADVAAFLAAKGMTLPEELTAAIENEKEDAAFHVLSATVSDDTEMEESEVVDYVTDLQVRLFGLAQDIRDNHKHEVRNVGQGQKDQTMFTVETHAGTLFVRLSR